MTRASQGAIDRREEILRSAVQVIGRRGHADTRLSHVAERAGVSQALVVYYFGTRESLLAQALAYSDARFYDRAATEMAKTSTATRKLIRLLEMSCMTGNPDDPDQPSWVLWLDLWAVAARNPEVAEHRRKLDRHWRETIGTVVSQGVASGEFQAVNVDDFTLRLAAMVDGLAVQVALEDSEVNADRMLQLCLGYAASALGFALPRRRAVRAPRAVAEPRRVAVA
ncbi:MAG: TetR/AcrR family transcriptional regulator [Candidatus Dormibacteria bacterium]